MRNGLVIHVRSAIPSCNHPNSRGSFRCPYRSLSSGPSLFSISLLMSDHHVTSRSARLGNGQWQVQTDPRLRFSADHGGWHQKREKEGERASACVPTHIHVYSYVTGFRHPKSTRFATKASIEHATLARRQQSHRWRCSETRQRQ